MRDKDTSEMTKAELVETVEELVRDNERQFFTSCDNQNRIKYLEMEIITLIGFASLFANNLKRYITCEDYVSDFELHLSEMGGEDDE